ncbi:anti-sigma-I factor RsgI family protein [Peptoclostridium acidaminophilum]|uniref:anti-sigma-I factor RsgI family protein n=1 Tax=Peptoclostridium acidaminophilum TaxID=1731 RepID=UPI00046CF0C2|nr:hypothetical protein [Peptoclostridium acidaminophilum]
MIHKGIVMDVQKSHVMVMSEDFEYFKIKPLKCSKGSNIFFTDDDIIRLSGGMRRFIASSVAAVLIIASLFGLSGGFGSPYSYAAILTLDDGASVEFLLDKDMKVKDIKSNSQATEDITKDKYLGLAIEHAVESLAEYSIQDSEANTIIVSVIPLKNKHASNETSIKSAIYEQLLNDTEIENLNIVYVKSSSKNYKNAKHSGISVLEYELKASKAEDASTAPEYKSLGFEVISKENGQDTGESSRTANPAASENAGRSSENVPAAKNAQPGSKSGNSKSNTQDTGSGSVDSNQKNSNGKTNNTNNGNKK